jgi:hypothetical protein
MAHKAWRSPARVLVNFSCDVERLACPASRETASCTEAPCRRCKIAVEMPASPETDGHFGLDQMEVDTFPGSALQPRSFPQHALVGGVVDGAVLLLQVDGFGNGLRLLAAGRLRERLGY